MLTRCEAAIDNDWGDGVPAPGLPANDFSVRWTAEPTFTAGAWRFTTTSDDGIRLLVDGTAVIDNWTDHGPTTDTGTRTLTAGAHSVVVEYYEKGGGAEARASWMPEPTGPAACPAGELKAEYFTNRTLSGTRRAARVPQARQGRRAHGDVPPLRRRPRRLRRRRLRHPAVRAGPHGGRRRRRRRRHRQPSPAGVVHAVHPARPAAR